MMHVVPQPFSIIDALPSSCTVCSRLYRQLQFVSLMSPFAVRAGGRRYVLHQIDRLSQSERCRRFPKFNVRKCIVRAFVRRKLKSLVSGVRWEGVVGCRFKREDFPRIKKREMRWIRGKVFSKKSRCKHSFL